MRCTYFLGPWRGIGAAMELLSEETGKSVAELIRIGSDCVLQHHHKTGRLPESRMLSAPSRRTRRAEVSAPPDAGIPATAKRASLNELHRDAVNARSDANRFRSAWVEFGLKYGEHAKAVAKAGGHGYVIWLRLKVAIEREKAANAKAAEARLAALPANGRGSR